MGPPDSGEAPVGTRASVSASQHAADNPIISGPADTPQQIPAITSSQQVSWWSVHEFVAPILARAGAFPMAGTPAWCALDDSDPVKTAALLDAAQHWALRVETCQVAECEASRDVSAAADWSAISQEIKARSEFYAERPWLKRVSA